MAIFAVLEPSLRPSLPCLDHSAAPSWPSRGADRLWVSAWCLSGCRARCWYALAPAAPISRAQWTTLDAPSLASMWPSSSEQPYPDVAGDGDRVRTRAPRSFDDCAEVRPSPYFPARSIEIRHATLRRGRRARAISCRCRGPEPRRSGLAAQFLGHDPALPA